MTRIIVLSILFTTVLFGQNAGSGRRIWQTGAGVNIAVPNVGVGASVGGAVGISPNGRAINNGGFNNGYGGFGGLIAPASPTLICGPFTPPGIGAVSIKFDLDLVPKEFRKMAQRGIIVVDGYEQAPVDRHDGWFNSGIQVAGCMDHDILITLEDGQIYQTHVNVGVRGTLVRYPRFKQPETKPVITPPVLTERPRDANGEPIPVPEVEKQ